MINMGAVPFLAFKDMTKDKKIFILVVCLLAFSYVNMTFFPAFLNGLSNTFQDAVVETETSHIIIDPRVESNQQYLNFESSTRKKIDLIPGVVASSAHISLAGTVSFEERKSGARIEALIPSDDMQVTIIHEKLVKGEYLKDSDMDEIVIGESIAGKKIEDTIGKQGGFGRSIEGLGGVDIGDSVKIRFSNGVEKSYKVKGIVGSEGLSFVSSTIYMNKKEAEEVLGINDKASSILVRLNDKNEADRYKQLILQLGLVNANIQTWKEASAFVEGINQTFGIVIAITSMVGVIIVMATVGIVVFINTSRKKKIIGVLRSVGMKQNNVLMIFLFESFLFGVIGTLLGVAIVHGVVFLMALYPIALPIGNLVPVLAINSVVNSALILVAASIIAGYFPARIASRQNLMDSIKGE